MSIGVQRVATQQSALLRSVTGRPAPGGRQVQPAAIRPPTTIEHLNRTLAQIPAARYALRRRDGGIDFFEVRRIGAGRTMLLRLHGAPGSFRAQAMSVRLQGFAALHILESPKEAARLFAAMVGECARCGSPLTQEDSRARGLGPRCATYF